MDRVRALVGEADQAGLTRLFSLRHDFPSEWYAFTTGTGDFTATLRETHFRYFTRSEDRAITLTGARLYALTHTRLTGTSLDDLDLAALSAELGQDTGATLSLPRDPQVLVADDTREVFLMLTYTLT